MYGQGVKEKGHDKACMQMLRSYGLLQERVCDRQMRADAKLLGQGR